MAIVFRVAPSQEPLQKGLIDGVVSEFSLITLNDQEKNNFLTQQFILVFTFSQLITPPKR